MLSLPSFICRYAFGFSCLCSCSCSCSCSCLSTYSQSFSSHHVTSHHILRLLSSPLLSSPLLSSPLLSSPLLSSPVPIMKNEEAEELMRRIEKEEERLSFTEPDKQCFHLCIVNLGLCFASLTTPSITSKLLPNLHFCAYHPPVLSYFVTPSFIQFITLLFSICPVLLLSLILFLSSYLPSFLPSFRPWLLIDLLFFFSLSFFFPTLCLVPFYSPLPLFSCSLFLHFSLTLSSFLSPPFLSSSFTSPTHSCIHTHKITVIGTLYCAKGNFEFGISRIIKVTPLILTSYPYSHYTP